MAGRAPEPVMVVRNEHKVETVANLVALKMVDRLKTAGIPVIDAPNRITPEQQQFLRECRQGIASAKRPYEKARIAAQAIRWVLYREPDIEFSRRLALRHPGRLVYSLHGATLGGIRRDWRSKLEGIRRRRRIPRYTYNLPYDLFATPESREAQTYPVHQITMNGTRRLRDWPANRRVYEIHQAERPLWGVPRKDIRRVWKKGGRTIPDSVGDVKKTKEQGADLDALAEVLAEQIIEEYHGRNRLLETIATGDAGLRRGFRNVDRRFSFRSLDEMREAHAELQRTIREAKEELDKEKDGVNHTVEYIRELQENLAAETAKPEEERNKKIKFGPAGTHTWTERYEDSLKRARAGLRRASSELKELKHAHQEAQEYAKALETAISHVHQHETRETTT